MGGGDENEMGADRSCSCEKCDFYKRLLRGFGCECGAVFTSREVFCEENVRGEPLINPCSDADRVFWFQGLFANPLDRSANCLVFMISVHRTSFPLRAERGRGKVGKKGAGRVGRKGAGKGGHVSISLPFVPPYLHTVLFLSVRENCMQL